MTDEKKMYDDIEGAIAIAKAAAAKAASEVRQSPEKPVWEPYQERVFEERDQIQERSTKLDAFMGGYFFKTLPEDERFRLIRQRDAMHQYEMALAERILHFRPL